MSRLVGAVARALMAPVFIRGGINQVKKAHRLAPSVDAALEEYGIEASVSGEELVKLNGIGMTVAGGALALGVFPRTSALALAGLLVPTTLVGQAFWKTQDERKRATRLSGALSNAAIIGGLLLVATRRRR
ncbi:DoxX family protein [Actinomyces sp. oral taxon 414]|uniref:DoxX family protein n=1 Tax=Actinomyces sp. oral taxon 414 TaxID=712122 RepID=UPI0006AFA046|nr:DoxX family protein [Actinomyces sp. oral taxon 414]ALC98386.1 DoxX family protein [Actinomyces sp. oral taxon 414]